MSRPRLTLEEIAKGLEHFSGRYRAIDVFANDIDELHLMKKSPMPPSIVPQNDSGRLFIFTSSAGTSYQFEIIPEHGVARLTRDGSAEMLAAFAVNAAIGGAIGTAIGAAIDAAETVKGDHWKTGLVLGLLAGVILAPAPDLRVDERRIFALRFDPDERIWRTSCHRG